MHIKKSIVQRPEYLNTESFKLDLSVCSSQYDKMKWNIGKNGTSWGIRDDSVSHFFFLTTSGPQYQMKHCHPRTNLRFHFDWIVS